MSETASAAAWAGFTTAGWSPAGNAPLDWLPGWLGLGRAGAGDDIWNAWVLLLACVPAVALLIDRMLGEPPVRWHPVVWMGAYLGALGRRIAPPAPAPGEPLQPGSPLAAWLGGALAWCLGAALVVSVAIGLQAWVLSLPIGLTVLALAMLLKPLLSWAMLHDEVLAVEGALAQSLAAGRQQLARLVSRDTQSLDAATVRESAIETLAENLNDSLVAPLFWFVLLGLPGAALYRFANTADAMWGYRGAHAGRVWTWAGRFAARADDVLSWAPARLTAALLMVGASLLSWRQLWSEAAQTPSPNGGWPMGAMALRLGVRLHKPGVYALNAQAPAPQAEHSLRAASLAGRACALATVLASLSVLALLCAGGGA